MSPHSRFRLLAGPFVLGISVAPIAFHGAPSPRAAVATEQYRRVVPGLAADSAPTSVPQQLRVRVDISLLARELGDAEAGTLPVQIVASADAPFTGPGGDVFVETGTFSITNEGSGIACRWDRTVTQPYFILTARREVMMWLGDLRGLPGKERLYLRSENIPSSHDIGSEWYQSQIEAVFTNHSQESRALTARFSFNATLADQGFSISHLDAEAITRAAELKRPVVWTEDGIRNAVSAMHHVFVETLDKSGIEEVLTRTCQ